MFVIWKGDHPPRHVHVYEDGKEVLKWNLDAGVAMRRRANRRVEPDLLATRAFLETSRSEQMPKPSLRLVDRMRSARRLLRRLLRWNPVGHRQPRPPRRQAIEGLPGRRASVEFSAPPAMSSSGKPEPASS